MRDYYYCDATNAIYTWNERAISCYPSIRFQYIGKHKSREKAIKSFENRFFTSITRLKNYRVKGV